MLLCLSLLPWLLPPRHSERAWVTEKLHLTPFRYPFGWLKGYVAYPHGSLAWCRGVGISHLTNFWWTEMATKTGTLAVLRKAYLSMALPLPSPTGVTTINILNQYMSFLFKNSIHHLIGLPCMIYCILEIDLYVFSAFCSASDNHGKGRWSNVFLWDNGSQE